MMHILWLVNELMPEASKLLGQKPSPYGGWLHQSATKLSTSRGVKLTVLCPYQTVNDTEYLHGEKITYVLFDKERFDETVIHQIVERQQPDLIHMYGTEYQHTLTMMRYIHLHDLKHVISIQGVMQEIAKVYSLGLPKRVKHQKTFRDLIRRDNILNQEQKFHKRALKEIEALKLAKHVIGRTDWDKEILKSDYPHLIYHHVNETLRDAFYEDTWKYQKIEKHTIFYAQAIYPIKGLHIMIEALAKVKVYYPDVELLVAGVDIYKDKSLMDMIKRTSYASYILKKMRKLKVYHHVTFLGELDVLEMKERYLRSHLFASASVIENSSNALGEAMLLGMPIVSSNTGGTPSMILDQEEGLLHDVLDADKLAKNIMIIFKQKKLAESLGARAQMRAMITHDPKKNLKDLKAVYQSILK